MLPESVRERGFEREWIFAASRSSGPGGQHVNKVSTRVELRFHVPASRLLDEEEKSLILASLKHYMNKEGFLILVSQVERSQYANRKKVSEKFYKLVQKALTPPAERKSTRPTAASKERRIIDKKRLSERKTFRRDPHDEE